MRLIMARTSVTMRGTKVDCDVIPWRSVKDFSRNYQQIIINRETQVENLYMEHISLTDEAVVNKKF